MTSRFLAFTLVALLLVFGASAVALSRSVYAQEDDLWYTGEGIKQDMYVTYRTQELDTNEGLPYEITMYFQEQQDGDWIVPTFVVDDNGRVIEGTWKLSDSMQYIGGGSNVPDEMNDFIGGYSGSLHFLDYTKMNPKSLAPGTDWGKIGGIGTSDLIVKGPETVTVEAGSFDATLLTYYKGITSRFWVLNGFPFPIKAEYFTDSTKEGNQQIQLKFELLATGMGKPQAPTSDEHIPTPPLTKKTGRGDYAIGIDWEPALIEPNSNVIFTVTLQDTSKFPLANANYDFVVKSANGSVVQEFKDQNADSEFGTGTHEVHFDNAGPMTVTVTINSVNGQTTGVFTESADFNIVVVPEFPTSAAIVAAAVIGLVVLMTRARGTRLGSLFGSKGAL